jgi:competence protein ComEA
MNNRWIRELFNFSRKERTGILVLLFIIFGLIICGKLIPLLIHSEKTSFSEWEAEVNTYLAKTENKTPAGTTLHPEPFNPNLVDSVSLVKTGLPAKVISNWMNYLRKGGSFRNKEGVKKIFGMTTELYDQLDSFIIIPEKTFNKVKERREPKAGHSYIKYNDDTIPTQLSSKKEKSIGITVELNSTDSIHLLEIPGIGEVLASRIIRYRNLLGGYYNTEQLKEVYGLRAENFMAASSHLKVDLSAVKTVDINFSTVQELGHHPYVGYKTARKIIKLRDRLGKFAASADLIPVVSGDSLNRLIPYIKFSQ